MPNQRIPLLLFFVAFYSASATSGFASAQTVEVVNAFVRVHREVEIPAREPGVLQILEVQAGDLIRRGDIIGRIDDTDAKLATVRAKRDLDITKREATNQLTIEFARKALERADVELANAEEAKRRVPGSIPDSRLDDLRLALERAKYELRLSQYNVEVSTLQLKLKESEVELAERGIERRQVMAPLDGQVVEVVREAGEWVEPGKTIVKVVDLDLLRIDGYIKPEHIQPGLVGSPVTIRAKTPDKVVTLVGRVTFVHPERKPVTAQARIWAEFKNAKHQLAPGMPVSAQIQIQPANGSAESSPDIPRVGSKKGASSN